MEPRIYEDGGVGDDWRGRTGSLVPDLDIGNSFVWLWEATEGINVLLYEDQSGDSEQSILGPKQFGDLK